MPQCCSCCGCNRQFHHGTSGSVNPQILLWVVFRSSCSEVEPKFMKLYCKFVTAIACIVYRMWCWCNSDGITKVTCSTISTFNHPCCMLTIWLKQYDDAKLSFQISRPFLVGLSGLNWCKWLLPVNLQRASSSATSTDACQLMLKT